MTRSLDFILQVIVSHWKFEQEGDIRVVVYEDHFNSILWGTIGTRRNRTLKGKH